MALRNNPINNDLPGNDDFVTIPTLKIGETFDENNPSLQAYRKNLNLVDIYNQKDGVVKIEVTIAPGPDGETKTRTGTGAIATSDGKVVTDYHVAAGANEIIMIYKGERRKARVLELDPAHDLAVLQFEPKSLYEVFPSLAFSAINPDKNAQVAAAGNPRGANVTVFSEGNYLDTLTLEDIFKKTGKNVSDVLLKDSTGKIIELKERPIQVAYLNVDRGSSGGPLFDEERKRVVGLVDMKLTDSNNPKHELNTTLVTPSHDVMTALLQSQENESGVSRASTVPLISLYSPLAAMHDTTSGADSNFQRTANDVPINSTYQPSTKITRLFGNNSIFLRSNDLQEDLGLPLTSQFLNKDTSTTVSRLATYLDLFSSKFAENKHNWLKQFTAKNSNDSTEPNQSV